VPSVTANVDLIEPMGLSTLIHVTLAGKPVKIFTLARPDLAIDSTVQIAFNMDKTHIFDSETELRMPPASEPLSAQTD
jgi:multiple sugar transport system ATP-binding protein